jgi:hypothetical protein
MVSEQNTSTYLTNRTLKSITSGSLTGTLTNFSGSAAAVNSTVNNVIQPRLVIGSNGTLTNYDFTLRVATPQIEKGPFPTSFIPTTTAAVTRTADILKVATTGGWYSTSAHTAISRSISSTNNNSYAIILEGDTIKGVSQSYASPSSYELNARNISGTNSVISSTSVNSAGIANTFGITYDASLPSFAANGSLVNRNSSAAVLGTPAYFYLGSRNGTSLFLNGWISKAKYYPARVSDTQLQLLTQ